MSSRGCPKWRHTARVPRRARWAQDALDAAGQRRQAGQCTRGGRAATCIVEAACTSIMCPCCGKQHACTLPMAGCGATAARGACPRHSSPAHCRAPADIPAAAPPGKPAARRRTGVPRDQSAGASVLKCRRISILRHGSFFEFLYCKNSVPR